MNHVPDQGLKSLLSLRKVSPSPKFDNMDGVHKSSEDDDMVAETQFESHSRRPVYFLIRQSLGFGTG